MSDDWNDYDLDSRVRTVVEINKLTVKQVRDMGDMELMRQPYLGKVALQQLRAAVGQSWEPALTHDEKEWCYRHPALIRKLIAEND